MPNISFTELLNEWLLSQKDTLKAGTYYSYNSRITSMISPFLGNKIISEMSANDISDFTAELQNRGLSSKTVKLAMTVVRSAVQYGIEHYGMENIVPNELSLPSNKKVEHEPLAFTEQCTLTEFALLHPTRANLCILLAMMTGVKVGELCGIRCGDLNFERGSVQILRIVYRTSRPSAEKANSSSIVIQDCDEPREIPVPSVLMNAFAKLHNNVPEKYLFSGKQDPTEPRTALVHLKKILAKCEIHNVSFNGLRCTFVQNCIAGGGDIMTVAMLLGTNSLNKLLTDFDWRPAEFEKAAVLVEEISDKITPTIVGTAKK